MFIKIPWNKESIELFLGGEVLSRKVNKKLVLYLDPPNPP